MNHEPDTVQYSIRPGWQARYETELGPPGIIDDHTAEITAIVPPGTGAPLPAECMLAAVRLASRVVLCEGNTDDRKRLDQFLRARVEGRANPLGNLRQYQDIQYDVNDAVQLFTPCGSADDWFAAAHVRHGCEWLGGAA